MTLTDGCLLDTIVANKGQNIFRYCHLYWTRWQVAGPKGIEWYYIKP